MVGSPGSQGTRENNFRGDGGGGGKNLREAEPWGSEAAQQRMCWGWGEEDPQASSALQVLLRKSGKTPGKKDQSCKGIRAPKNPHFSY